MKSHISWEESKNLCEQNGSKLVSMEHLRAEMNFLENQSEALKMNTIEYYIGLRRKGQKWIWVSDNSTLEETKKGHFPWAPGDPSGNGNCVKMWRQKTSPWTYMYEGGVRVCGIAVLGFFWCGVAVIFISKYGIAVFRAQAVCGEFKFYVAVVGEKIVMSR